MCYAAWRLSYTYWATSLLPLLGLLPACFVLGGVDEYEPFPTTAGSGGEGGAPATTTATGGGSPTTTGSGSTTGAGGGAQCSVPGDCGPDMACGARTCDGNMCGWEIDDTDLPADVALDCRLSVCNGGVAALTDEPNDAACDDSAAEALGQCLGGICVDCTQSSGCDVGHACLVDNSCCTPVTAAMACAGAECGAVSDGCGGTVDCGLCTTAASGDDCDSATNACFCDNNNDCAHAGADGSKCIGADSACGCTKNSECGVSSRGRFCFTATKDCGCTVMNEANNCAGIGPISCNAATSTCFP